MLSYCYAIYVVRVAAMVGRSPLNPRLGRTYRFGQGLMIGPNRVQTATAQLPAETGNCAVRPIRGPGILPVFGGISPGARGDSPPGPAPVGRKRDGAVAAVRGRSTRDVVSVAGEGGQRGRIDRRGGPPRLPAPGGDDGPDHPKSRHAREP